MAGLATAIANWIIRLWVFYFRRTTGREKCPGCGQRKTHKVIFRREYEKLIHQCAFCSAVWGSDPLIIASQWLVEMAAPEADTGDDGPRLSFAQREPLREPMKHNDLPIQH